VRQWYNGLYSSDPDLVERVKVMLGGIHVIMCQLLLSLFLDLLRVKTYVHHALPCMFLFPYFHVDLVREFDMVLLMLQVFQGVKISSNTFGI
jgi:hypothetical protein